MTETPPLNTAAVRASGRRPTTSASAVFLVLRRMRAPLFVLIVIYTVSVLGLMLIPGEDAQGRPTAPLSFFHAFYFVSYTATTIGFGELPVPFSDAQRLWATLSIYLTVVGWSYSVVTLLALVQDKALAATITANRFSRRVRRITEPFYLLCGGGSTGMVILKHLSSMNHQVVVVDIDESRIQELDLEDLPIDPPLFSGDAGQIDVLLRAGLRHPQCQGVMAVTDDDNTNLAVAIAAKLLNPSHPVVARVTDPVVADNMASFGTDHILNPFAEFAHELALSISSPERYRLSEIVTGLPGSPLPIPRRPPKGEWIVVGYGRFGRLVTSELRGLGLKVSVIDAKPADQVGDIPEGVRLITGHGTQAEVLFDAGIRDASGIVAATDNDVDNLSVAMTARDLEPLLYLVMRQNRVANQPLFDAFPHEAEMVSTRIIAEESVALVTAPMINRFDHQLESQSEQWCSELINRLCDLGRGSIPPLWQVAVAQESAHEQSLSHAISAGYPVRIDDLLRDHRARDTRMHALALLIEGQGRTELLPPPSTLLHQGDQVLFAGSPGTMRRMRLTLGNPGLLDYVLTGSDGGGWLHERLHRPLNSLRRD